MFDRIFRLRENGANIRTELLAGTTTFLTMAYIIFVQPAVLGGSMFGQATGMDFGAVTTATCLSAALASAIMGLYARYPIAQAPGMGENFFFVLTLLPAAAVAFAPQIAVRRPSAFRGCGTVGLRSGRGPFRTGSRQTAHAGLEKLAPPRFAPFGRFRLLPPQIVQTSAAERTAHQLQMPVEVLAPTRIERS